MGRAHVTWVLFLSLIHIFLPGGAVWFVELKRARGGVVSPRQRVVHSKISRGGHNVVVLAGVDEVKMWIRERESELENGTDE